MAQTFWDQKRQEHVTVLEDENDRLAMATGKWEEVKRKFERLKTEYATTLLHQGYDEPSKCLNAAQSMALERMAKDANVKKTLTVMDGAAA
ncbi:hypothetical protein KAJ83_01645 [Marivibrio halodurans]|uniref:Uncharacterized protein n=1 Tax=Marivibrio halodurans TaxID=2039722 RepID=A0A8J7SKR6_9PROT|nr:hypothetical protein [Marivibrio halodurans]MBP5855696.1 hypothetical protein [Marivibrio halodurans]